MGDKGIRFEIHKIAIKRKKYSLRPTHGEVDATQRDQMKMHFDAETPWLVWKNINLNNYNKLTQVEQHFVFMFFELLTLWQRHDSISPWNIYIQVHMCVIEWGDAKKGPAKFRMHGNNFSRVFGDC